jgi:hypothetical protein
MRRFHGRTPVAKDYFLLVGTNRQAGCSQLAGDEGLGFAAGWGSSFPTLAGQPFRLPSEDGAPTVVRIDAT